MTKSHHSKHSMKMVSTFSIDTLLDETDASTQPVMNVRKDEIEHKISERFNFPTLLKLYKTHSTSSNHDIYSPNPQAMRLTKTFKLFQRVNNLKEKYSSSTPPRCSDRNYLLNNLNHRKYIYNQKHMLYDCHIGDMLNPLTPSTYLHNSFIDAISYATPSTVAGNIISWKSISATPKFMYPYKSAVAEDNDIFEFLYNVQEIGIRHSWYSFLPANTSNDWPQIHICCLDRCQSTFERREKSQAIDPTYCAMEGNYNVEDVVDVRELKHNYAKKEGLCNERIQMCDVDSEDHHPDVIQRTKNRTFNNKTIEKCVLKGIA